MTVTRIRAWIYDCLARLVDGGIDDLPDPPDLSSAPGDLRGIIERLRAAIAHSSRDEFSATQARLFVNARDGIVAPPYASWYLDRCLCGPSSAWAAQAYAAQGLEREPDAGEPPDYLGTELEFMYFLARHELAARGTGDAAALHAILDTQAAFVTRHLARWTPAFIARVRAAGPGPVFGAAVDLLERALQDDIRQLADRVSKPAAICADC